MLATAELHSVAQRLRDVDADLVMGDLYADGSDAYHELARFDQSEIAQVVGLARGLSTPVLELACGSGRLALPLMAAGNTVVAVDNEPRMLELLAEEVASMPARFHDRIQPVLADMSSLDLGRLFDLVYCGITSITVLPDDARQSMFRRSASHLTQTGAFVFSVVEVDAAVSETATPLVSEDGGSLFTLLERVDHGLGIRTVSVLEQPLCATRPRSLYTTEVKLLAADNMVVECEAAGLRVDDVAVTSALGDRRFVTITCGRADR